MSNDSVAPPSPRPLPGGTLCVATPRMQVYSETFVKAHIDRLADGTRVLYRDPISAEWEGKPLVRPTVARRIVWRAVKPLGKDLRERSRDNAVAGWLARNRIKAVLAEFGPTAAQMALPCARAKVPLVAHFHGYDAFADYALKEMAGPYKQLFATAAAVVGVSDPMCAQLISLGAPAAKVHRVPYGVDLKLFAEVDAGANPPHFLSVGRFVEKKAPYLALLAFADVVRREPSARLTMAGDGYLLEACREIARGLRLDDRVSFPGAVSHADVAALMHRSRAYVQHSIRPANGDSEGTPVAVLEASASGLPVVATRHAGIPEAVADGTTGLLVDERDVTGMADAMVRLVNDPAAAGAMGAAGRRHVGEHYQSDRQIGRLRAVIEAVMGGG